LKKQKNGITMDLSIHMIKEIPSLVKHHYRAGTINWPMSIYITLVHVIGFVGVAKVIQCKMETLMWAFLLWPIR
jgi:hypothetical protein